MSILSVLLVLVIIGVVLYLVNQYIPMDPQIKKIINIVIVLLIIAWLLKIVGAFTYLNSVRI